MGIFLTPVILASCDCQGELTCYRNQCRTAAEIALEAFEAGKPCDTHDNCKEACMPPKRHEDECGSDEDCNIEEESCIATLGGMECATWQTIMIEVFKIGTPCKSSSDCPEACYIHHDDPTCGPYLN